VPELDAEQRRAPVRGQIVAPRLGEEAVAALEAAAPEPVAHHVGADQRQPDGERAGRGLPGEDHGPERRDDGDHGEPQQHVRPADRVDGVGQRGHSSQGRHARPPG
jgi:hypothetical protein